MQTRDQKQAQIGYDCVKPKRCDGDKPDAAEKEYRTFALGFSALIHGSGLAQAISFAEAKGHTEYLTDLKKVMQSIPDEKLGERVRTIDYVQYIHLSLEALESAGWLKRYSEALLRSGEEGAEDDAENSNVEDKTLGGKGAQG